MIYTVTLNPAIDYVLQAGKIRTGEINRSWGEKMYCGGKGINVSRVLANLGLESIPIGFAAGITGEMIERGIKEAGLAPDFIRLREGMSRVNIKLKAREETEINGSGPPVYGDELQKMLEKLNRLQNGDMLVLAGSIPRSLSDGIYGEICSHLQDRQVLLIVDAAKNLLLNTLRYRPFLIKPNHHELGEMFGVQLKRREEISKYAERLLEMGARNVLVSMAGDGAVLYNEKGQIYTSPCPEGEVKNSVGAGDSMLAGFLAGYIKSGGDYRNALRMGIAAGSATAFSEDLASEKQIMELYERNG